MVDAAHAKLPVDIDLVDRFQTLDRYVMSDLKIFSLTLSKLDFPHFLPPRWLSRSPEDVL